MVGGVPFQLLCHHSVGHTRAPPGSVGHRRMNSHLNILTVKKVSKSFSSPPKTSAAETGRMSSVETGQMSVVETGQMSAVETGQMSAAETGQMSVVETGPMSSDETRQISSVARLCCVNTQC